MIPRPRPRSQALARHRWRDGYSSDDDDDDDDDSSSVTTATTTTADLDAHIFSDRESDLSSDNMSVGDLSTDSFAAVPSVIRRLVQIAIGITSCVLSAGIIYGYAALKPLLVEEGVYHHLCRDDELHDNGATVCYRQNLRLDFMFALAAAISCLAASPARAIANDFGPRDTSMLGAALLAVGALLFAFARHLPVIDGYVIGYSVFSVAAAMVVASQAHLAEASRRFSGAIQASQQAAVEASVLVFLIFRVLHSVFSLQTLFLLYLVVPAFVIFANLSIMPSTSYQRAKAERTPETHEEFRYAYAVWEFGRDRRTPRSRESTLCLLHHIPASSLIRSPWCILLAACTLINFLHINYFIASVHEQSHALLTSPDRADALTHAFQLLLPLGAILCIPLTRLLLARARASLTTTSTLLLLLVAATTALPSALGCIAHSPTAAYARLVLFACHRPFFHAAVSHYTHRVFGPLNAPAITARALTPAAALGALLVVPLDALRGGGGGDGAVVVPINAALAGAGLCSGVALAGYVYSGTKRMGARQGRAIFPNGGHGDGDGEREFSVVGEVTAESETLLGSSEDGYSFRRV